MKFQLFITFICLSITYAVQSQTCLALPELNGTPQTTAAPSGWNIWHGTPDIISGNGYYPTGLAATVENINQPSYAGGEMVFFIINAASGANTESIYTELTNLTIGESYTINLEWQQATLDYTNYANDFSGGHLEIYLDGIMQNTFVSNAGIEDDWQVVNFTFTATSISHTLGLKGALLNGSSRGAIVIDNSFCISPLPIELTKFIAEKQLANTQLSWESTSETNSDSFTIERFSNDKTWSAITTIEAIENPSTHHQYEFLDMHVPQQMLYYRLKQTDFNGSISYSNILTVDHMTTSEDDDILVFPNPTVDYLTVSCKKFSHLSIINQFGQPIDLTSIIISKTDNQIKIDVTSITNGIYMILNGNKIKQFIKQ
jgi:hypothetical protein